MNLNLLEQYCEVSNIAVNTFQKAAELLNDPDFEIAHRPSRGMLIRAPKEDWNMILYDDNLPPEDKYFTFAHEIAHHALEHLTRRSDKRNAAEAEADVFASVLMALTVFDKMKGVVA